MTWYELFLWAKEHGMFPSISTCGNGMMMASVFSDQTLERYYGMVGDLKEALLSAINAREQAHLGETE